MKLLDLTWAQTAYLTIIELELLGIVLLAFGVRT